MYIYTHIRIYLFSVCNQLYKTQIIYIYTHRPLIIDFKKKYGTRKTSSDSVPPTYPQKTPQSTIVLLFPADFFPRFTALIEGKVYRESSFLPLKSRKHIDDSLGLYSSINLWEGSFPWFPVNFPHQPIPGWVSHGPIHQCRIWHRHFPAICLGTKMCHFQPPLRMVVDWGDAKMTKT